MLAHDLHGLLLQNYAFAALRFAIKLFGKFAIGKN